MGKKPFFVAFLALLWCFAFPFSSRAGHSRITVYMGLDRAPSSDVWFKVKDLSLGDVSGRWLKLRKKTIEFDSSKIGKGQILVGSFCIPSGEYRYVRLVLEKAAVVRKDKLILLALPRKEFLFSIQGGLRLRDGDSTCLFMEWDVDGSIKGRFSFVPAMSLRVQSIPLRGELLYVTCDDIDTLYVVRTDVNHVVGSLGLGSSPKAMAVSSENNRLYVVESGSRDIRVIELSTCSSIDSIFLPFMVRPVYLCLSPDMKRAFVTDPEGNYVARVDLVSGVVEARAEIGYRPFCIAYMENTGELAVSSPLSQCIYLLDPETLRVKREIKMGSSPEGLLYVDGILYVADGGSGNVIVYSPRVDGVLGKIGVGFQPKRMVFGAGRIYVSNYREGAIDVVMPGQFATLRSIYVGFGPTEMAVCKLRSWLYVAMRETREVVAIDLASGRVISRIPLGGKPFYLKTLR